MSTTREDASRIRAMFKTVLGKKPGFFIQYDFASSVEPITLYPDFAVKCSQANLAPI